MTTFDPFHPDFEDNPEHPWDPFYGGGPGDMHDPAEIPDPAPADPPEGD